MGFFEYAYIVDGIGRVIDFIGVMTLAIGVFISISIYLSSFILHEDSEIAYTRIRVNLAKTVLLGLEFLVAGDIIRSIAVPPTFESVIILAIIVLIRSFLAAEYEKKTIGKFPWERKPKEKKEE